MSKTLPAIVIFLSGFSSTGIAQTATDSPHFDAASVKPLEPQMRGAYFHTDAGRIDYHLTDLKTLILAAYPLPWFRVVWPEWLKGQPGPQFDVSAAYPVGTAKAQVQVMLQTMLAERFGLVTHREAKEMPVYALTVAETGLRIHKVENPTDDEPLALVESRSFAMNREGVRLTDQVPGREPNNEPGGISMSNLVDFVTGNTDLDRLLLDMTGLEGKYHMDLRIARDPNGMAPASEVFDDLRKQLGLKVEKKTLPVEMLVIDQLERVPTAN